MEEIFDFFKCEGGWSETETTFDDISSFEESFLSDASSSLYESGKQELGIEITTGKGDASQDIHAARQSNEDVEEKTVIPGGDSRIDIKGECIEDGIEDEATPEDVGIVCDGESDTYEAGNEQENFWRVVSTEKQDLSQQSLEINSRGRRKSFGVGSFVRKLSKRNWRDSSTAVVTEEEGIQDDIVDGWPMQISQQTNGLELRNGKASRRVTWDPSVDGSGRSRWKPKRETQRRRVSSIGRTGFVREGHLFRYESSNRYRPWNRNQRRGSYGRDYR